MLCVTGCSLDSPPPFQDRGDAPSPFMLNKKKGMNKVNFEFQNAIVVAIIAMVVFFILSCGGEDVEPDGSGYICGTDEAVAGAMGEFTPQSANKTLVIASGNAWGASEMSADSCVSLIRNVVEPYWDWHIEVDFLSQETILTYRSVPETPQPNYVDWVNNKILTPVIDSLAVDRFDFDYIVILLPKGNWGFQGAKAFNTIYVNVDLQGPSMEYILKHEFGHMPPMYLGHSKSWWFNDCVYKNAKEYGGDDPMGGSDLNVNNRLNPYQMNQLGILKPDTVTVGGDTVRVWLKSIESKTCIYYGPSRYVYLLPQNVGGHPAHEDKVSIIFSAYKRKNISSQEGTTYTTTDDVRVIVGKSAQSYINEGVDPMCVLNVEGTPDSTAYIISLVQLPPQCQ